MLEDKGLLGKCEQGPPPPLLLTSPWQETPQSEVKKELRSQEIQKARTKGGSALVGEASSTCADGKGTSSVGTLAAGEDSSACAVSTVPAVVPGRRLLRSL